MVRTNTTVTDFNRGSVIRTILEAAALEDDEQYYQMLQILRAFSYRTAPGTDLDRRAADFDIVRNIATPSTGEVLFLDGNLVRSYLVSGPYAAGSTTLTVENAAVFGAIATPFNIRLAEGSPVEEVVSCTAVNTTTNQLTVSATLNAHTSITSAPSTALEEYSFGAHRVAYVDGSPDRTINSGVLVGAPQIGDLLEVRFLVAGAATIQNGDYLSSLVPIRSLATGEDTNVGPKRIINFPGSTPFSGALVTNPNATGGGINVESDGKFADRIGKTIGSLSRGTGAAIRSNLLQVQVPTTLQRVARLYIQEQFVHVPTDPADGLVEVYIDDGTGSFVPEVISPALGNLFAAIGVGSTSFLANITEGTFTDTGHVLMGSGAGAEIIEYIASDFTVTPAVFTIDNGAGLAGDPAATILAHAAATTFEQVEEISTSTEAGRRFYRVQHIAIAGTTIPDFRLYKREVSGGVTTITLMTLNTDYYLNEGTGQIEIVAAAVPLAGSRIYAAYKRWGGLIELAQRTLDGDSRFPETYPGVRAAGIKALVKPASTVLVNVTLSLSMLEGFAVTSAIEQADRVIRNYINGLDVGADFIVNEMIERVMGLSGVYDVVVSLPTSNVTVNYNEVPAPGIIVIT